RRIAPCTKDPGSQRELTLVRYLTMQKSRAGKARFSFVFGRPIRRELGRAPALQHARGEFRACRAASGSLSPNAADNPRAETIISVLRDFETRPDRSCKPPVRHPLPARQV